MRKHCDVHTFHAIKLDRSANKLFVTAVCEEAIFGLEVAKNKVKKQF